MDPSAHRLAIRWPVVVGLAIVAVVVPVLFLGPGTDLDTGAVLQSGESILDGDYLASRAPGAPVHEGAVGVLHAIGGTTLTNLGSLVMGVLLVVALVLLLQRERVPHPELAAAVVVANPWFQVAATSTVDFVWAMAFAVLGALALRSAPAGRTGLAVVAGVLFGLGIGCRMSTVVVIAAALVAQLFEDADRRRAVVIAGVTAAVVSVLVYLPPYFAAGSSLAFANNDFATGSPLNHVGRALAKNLYFFGPYAAVAILIAIPALVRAQRQWGSSWALRFATIGLVASQLLFLRFPWKMGHLIPSLVCLAILFAVVFASRPRWLLALVGLQLLFGVVNIELFRPDTPNEATGARFEVDVRWGPFITDTRCRAQDQDAWIGNDRERLEAVWNCAKPWGTGP
jgi:hypothetical protein